MFKALFNIIINMLGSIIQILCWPLNTIISAALPDLSEKITFVTNTIGSIFNSISWGIIAAFIIGLIGALTMGFGMSKIMVDSASKTDMIIGLITGIIGLIYLL